jgi:hypothetical protein
MSLFRGLLAEGIIAEDKKWIGPNKPLQDIIRFTYERFTDHYIARYLLDKHLDDNAPSSSFLPNTPLGNLLNDEGACYQYQGILEAWSIQLPERIGLELPEVAPQCASFAATRRAFTQSIVWRRVDAFTEPTLAYINAEIIHYTSSKQDLIDAFITVCSNPDHPYNAEFLNGHLMQLTMPNRDTWWTIAISEMYGEHKSVDRIIDWAWETVGKDYVDDHSVYLCALTLTWFLTSSNRFLRDRATKALVSLLVHRLPIVSDLLLDFADVNDLYVAERLYAVAYGCAMRSRDLEGIGLLAQTTYDLIFKTGKPIPHILLRDSARGIIELALHLKATINVVKKRIRPPYGSEWPAYFPSDDDIAQYGNWHEDMSPGERAAHSIYASVMGFDDFARYVIGTNHGSFPWTSQLLTEPKTLSAGEIRRKFTESLTTTQHKAWEKYLSSHNMLKSFRDNRTVKLRNGDIVNLTDHDIEQFGRYFDLQFQTSLGMRKAEFFNKHVRPVQSESSFTEQHVFSLEPVQKWIVWKVFDLGWSGSLFGRYDVLSHDHRNYRTGHKAERIGKKYQWLALHEILARVADNFHFKSNIGTPDEVYDGAWQIGRRDIDPSLLISGSQSQSLWYNPSPSWWFSVRYDQWETIEDDEEWVRTASDFPSIKEFIRSSNPLDSSDWVALDLFTVLDEPTPLGEERSDLKRRHMQFSIKAYVVKKDKVEDIVKKMSVEPLSSHIIPGGNPLLDVYYGEHYGSPAYKYHDVPYHARGGWTSGRYSSGVSVLETTEHYLCESSDYDCSLTKDCNIRMPSRWISDGMQRRLSIPVRHSSTVFHSLS